MTFRHQTSPFDVCLFDYSNPGHYGPLVEEAFTIVRHLASATSIDLFQVMEQFEEDAIDMWQQESEKACTYFTVLFYMTLPFDSVFQVGSVEEFLNVKGFGILRSNLPPEPDLDQIVECGQLRIYFFCNYTAV